MFFDPTMKPEVDAASQNLLDAAAYIERHGHCKGEIEDDQGRVCALGALMQVGAIGTEASARLMQLVKKSGFYSIAPWNNAPERTQAEVVATMRAAAGR